MYSVLSELYHEVATHLVEAIDRESYFSGSLSFGFDGLDCRLTTSVIVYRSRESRPENEAEVITDLIPVWWEFHAIGAEGELLNDFDFSELKHHVVML